MKRWHRVAALTTAALALVPAGCGKQQSSLSADSPAITGSVVPVNAELAAAVVRAGERSCSDVTSGRLAMTIEVNGEDPAMTGTATIAMAFDRSNERALFSVDLSGLLGGGDDGSGIPSGGGAGLEDLIGTKAEVIFDGDTVYLDFPFVNAFFGVETKWAKLTRGTTRMESNPAPLGADGCEPLQMLEGIGAEVTEIGAEVVDDVMATRYRAVVDVDKALAEATGEERQRLEEFFEDFSETRQFPADIWIGEDGIVRRMTFTVDGYDVSNLSGGGGRRTPPGRNTAADAKASATFTLEFTDINQPVSIELPPADDVSEPSLDLGPAGNRSGGDVHGSGSGD